MSEARSVPVYVQVIDQGSNLLPLTVPVYLSVGDLTTRVARDAGLEAFWPDGRRRSFYLRARGRLLLPDDKLQDLDIVDHELLHLLPEPPADAGIEERPARYRAASSRPRWREWVGVGLAAMGLVAFAVADGVAVSVSRSAVTQGLGALGVGLLSTAVARRALGPPGSSLSVLGLAAAIGLPLTGVAALGSLGSDVDWVLRALGWLTALAGVVSGLLVGWMAWHEPVERLPDVSPHDARAARAAATWPCAVCDQPVTTEQRTECRHACGRVFHVGCHSAVQTDRQLGRCAVCGQAPHAA